MSSNETPRSSSSRPSASSASNSESQSGTTRNGAYQDDDTTTQTSWRADDEIRDSPRRFATVIDAELAGVDQSYEVQGERRRRPRNSGGFLLPSATVQSTSAGPSGNSTYGIVDGAKGKRKVQDEDLLVPKVRMNGRRHRVMPSLGSSPLSTEVYNVARPRGSAETGRSDPDAILPLPSGTSRTNSSLRSALSTDSEMESIQGNRDQHAELNMGNALGHDTDPMQIVHLALNLSENRRRNFSGGRLSPLYPATSRRVISSHQSSAGISSGFPVVTAGGSLRQHLQDQRRISRKISPRSSKLPRHGFESPLHLHDANLNPQSLTATTYDVSLADGMVFNPTEATLARAEKARIAIELSYEYRRLLQYLPRIPVRPGSRSIPSKSTAKASAEMSDILGRNYNPLQYIRNRRTRAREKRTLDADADGWGDVAKVRDWVSAVASEREAGVSRVDDRYPLLPYDVVSSHQASLDSVHAMGKSHLTGQSNSKSRTLPGNWTITPWDLLADAYWLRLDENMRRIEDSAGNKPFESAAILSEARPRSSQESRRAQRRPMETINKKSSAENLQAPTAAVHESPKERGRTRKHMHELQSPMHSHNSSLDRKSRWTRNIIRSRSSSNSDYSPTEPLIGRGRSHVGQDGFDSAALEKQMNDILKKEAEEDLLKRKDNSDRAQAKPTDYTQSNGTVPQQDSLRTKKTDRQATEAIPGSASIILDKVKDRLSRTSFESTRDTPSLHGSSPKIAIDAAPLSDPSSSPKKSLPSLLGSLRSSRSKDRHAISYYDFASESIPTFHISGQETTGLKPDSNVQLHEDVTTRDGLLSPDSAETSNPRLRNNENNSLRNIRIAKDSDSKFRGFLRGGRIAELVGNEVSRVGDLFSRKDRDNQSSPISPTMSSFATEDSEYDDDTSEIDSPPNAPLSRKTTNNEDTARLSQNSTNVDGPKYHMDLPSFRSSFGRGEHSVDSGKTPSEPDHITRQQLEQRQRGRSQRFDRLAPPRIDMRNVSPSASPPMTPSQTKETDISPDNSRQSSTSRSDYRARSTDRRLNKVLGAPGTVNSVPGPSILSGLDSRQNGRSQRPDLGKGRQWSICNRGVFGVRGTVTKRDIAHVRALLLSSGVKANEIVRRAHAVGEAPSLFLKGLQDVSSGPIPSVPRRQEHRLAARILVNNTELTNQKVQDAAEAFTHTTVENLHRQIKAIDERVTHRLTPTVRRAADDADDFSTQLTTTHTLAVKQLHDAVDVILRRRRRRLRWLRRGGYVLLEWTLLGIMWWVWFVVVIIRLIRGVVGARALPPPAPPPPPPPPPGGFRDQMVSLVVNIIFAL